MSLSLPRQKSFILVGLVPNIRITAIPMTSSSRDIYFHTPSGNQTKLCPVEKCWLESFIMSLPSPFLTNSFGSFLLITYQVFWY